MQKGVVEKIAVVTFAATLILKALRSDKLRGDERKDFLFLRHARRRAGKFREQMRPPRRESVAEEVYVRARSAIVESGILEKNRFSNLHRRVLAKRFICAPLSPCSPCARSVSHFRPISFFRNLYSSLRIQRARYRCVTRYALRRDAIQPMRIDFR
ncbi:hypothetical protein P5V15_000033 [Pogonomyrmex californicus]